MQWIARWERNGWRTAARQPVKNEEQGRRLDAALAGHELEWVWVRGHAGHKENERADALARAEAKKRMRRAGERASEDQIEQPEDHQQPDHDNDHHEPHQRLQPPPFLTPEPGG